MTDPASRVLDLLALLQTGREWGGPELADRLGVSARTIRRDVDRLRSLGYPVDTRPGPGAHYRLGVGAHVPPLMFADDEVVAVVTGLRTVEHRLGDGDAAGRARAKLERLLPPRLQARAAATDAVTEVVPDRFPAVDPDVIGLLADAAAEHGRIRFAYRDQHGAASARTVDPYRQVVNRGRWYLLGFDLERDDWRVFRLDRVADLERVPGTYARRALPAESAAAYLLDDFGRAPTPVSVVFDAALPDVARLLTRPDGELAATDDGRCRYTTHVGRLDWFAANLAVLGIAFEVEHPPQLTDACRTLAATLQR